MMNQEHIDTIESALEDSMMTQDAMTPDEFARWQARCQSALAALRQPPHPEGSRPQPLLCEQCNDYLEAPSYCEICYGTIESAFREADAKVAPSVPLPEEVAAILDRWQQLLSALANDLENLHQRDGDPLRAEIAYMQQWLAAQPGIQQEK